MTREEIEQALALLQSQTAHAPFVAKLADIVAEQERRLRVLEPCEFSPHGQDAPHEWTPIRTCVWCGVRR
jgi:hypothetical protein